MKRRIPKREKLFAVVPTLFTLGNAVCGFGAITFATKVFPEGTEDNGLWTAAWLILFAMVFDMLDGHAARLTKQTSEFGAQLDSLCDVISFGVAPAFLMLKLAQFPQVYHPRMLWVVAVLFVVCTVLRLARFNVETGEGDSHESFTGLPSPAAAGAVASFAIAMPGLTDPTMSETSQAVGGWLIFVITRGLPVFTLLLACLMVTRIRYPHVLSQLFRGRRNFQHLLQLIFAIVAIFAVHELAIPLILCYFVLASPIRALWIKVVHGRFRTSLRPSPEHHPPTR